MTDAEIDELVARTTARALGETVDGPCLFRDIARLVGALRAARAEAAELRGYRDSIEKRRRFAREYMARRRARAPEEHAAALLRKNLRRSAREEAVLAGEPVQAIYARWNVG